MNRECRPVTLAGLKVRTVTFSADAFDGARGQEGKFSFKLYPEPYEIAFSILALHFQAVGK